MSDLDEAMAHAQRFAQALEAEGLRPRVWGRAGVGARVYMGDQYACVGRDGSVKETQRGQATLVLSGLPRSHQPKYLEAKRRYLAELEARVQAEWDALEPNPAPTSAARRMFRTFHSREWRREGDFHADLVIPSEVVRLGAAEHVLYRSDKLNPTSGEDEGWIDYIHEHGSGVVAHRVEARPAADADLVAVPGWLQRQQSFTWLGKSLGFAYRDAGGRVRKVGATEPLPELYAAPSGRALLIIQSKRRLLAMIWGGRLAVQRRGIVH